MPLSTGQWTTDEAAAWQAAQPWTVGCNFIPSTAINQLEMWQAESWDPGTIERELGFAASIGMNAVRVYLHDLVWEADRDGFVARMNDFLKIASRHGIKALFVFFDDCWNPNPEIGTQPAPKPSVHNSGWVRSPGDTQRNWPADLGRLERYVTDVLTTFRDDARVWMWDLYNEPTNSNYGVASLELVQHVFDWARRVRPSQPLTCAGWTRKPEFDELPTELSDVVSFHNYDPVDVLKAHIDELRRWNRPIVCSEWMARTQNSRVETCLPVLKEEGVHPFNWGLVRGKTNTVFPWGTAENAPEPNPWFHDLFWPDGTPYSEEEVVTFRDLTAR